MQTLPTGTVSFLFTDIEGSTETLQRLGDQAYASLLEEHHRLLRGAFQRLNGHEINTQGDAFFVAFAEARDAVAAAVAAQQAVTAHTWPGGVPVRVRMGLHTGEPTPGPGFYVGIDVHRAARICSAGFGGQILLSERTHAAAERILPPGVTLRDLGEHRLKDLARSEHIYQIVVPGLAADFPPLKSLDVLTNNLPSLELTSFVGRERELVEIKRLLSASRLVTLVGPGGAGKTRLALEVAADLIEKFTHGAWLIELAPLSDPAVIVQVVATIFGVREMGRPLLDSLVDYLRTRDLLLVLDNCEHLIAAAAHTAHTLLRACPGLRIMATSREALGTAGEVVYRVPSLSMPDPRHVVSLDQLTQFDATRLFVERAAISSPQYVLTDAHAPLVAQISRRLDGIPLAIELAAARVKVLTVDQIARRLDDRFRLLASGSRTGLTHHQTLRATVDWSYDLLTEDERLMFRRLSVFAGGFALEAAEAVCAGDGLAADDVLDLLARLVDKSLAIAEAMDGDIRYRMLETIRHYSLERLVESGEAANVQRRHLDWHLSMAQQAEAALQGPEQLIWLDRLERDYDDLRAALQWARAEEAAVEPGARLAAALHRFWALRGYLREGREWLERLLENGVSVAPSTRARAAYGAGLLAFNQGDYGRAETLSRESMSLYRGLGDAAGIALSLNTLGIVARNRGDYKGARALLEESLALSRQANHKWALAEALNTLGVTVRRQGDRAAATTMFEESLGLWRGLGDRWGLAVSLGHLGVVARQHSNYERARALHEESLALRRQLGDRRLVAADLNSLGVVARHLGSYDQARSLLEESLALSRELGDKLNIAATLCTLGLVAHRQGDGDRAAALLQEGLSVSREQGDKLNTAAALCNLGFVAAAASDSERAGTLHREGLALYRELGDMAGISESLMGLAQVRVAQGRPDLAARSLAAAAVAHHAGGAAWPPSDRAEYDRSVAAVRALLTEEGFAAAWAQGHATPLDDAMSEALQ